jgi:hypothetical protein
LDPYELRHLMSHLVDSDRTDQLHWLLRLSPAIAGGMDS